MVTLETRDRPAPPPVVAAFIFDRPNNDFTRFLNVREFEPGGWCPLGTDFVVSPPNAVVIRVRGGLYGVATGRIPSKLVVERRNRTIGGVGRHNPIQPRTDRFSPIHVLRDSAPCNTGAVNDVHFGTVTRLLGNSLIVTRGTRNALFHAAVDLLRTILLTV